MNIVTLAIPREVAVEEVGEVTTMTVSKRYQAKQLCKTFNTILVQPRNHHIMKHLHCIYLIKARRALHSYIP
jgi:hypothetical protein